MRIKLKYPDVETFIQKYAVNISRGGIFIATKTPKPVGTPLKFEFVIAAGDAGLSVIRGEGQVLWTREFDPAQPSKAHGMGVKFTRLDADSQAIVDRALAFRAALQQPVEERREEPSGPIATQTEPPTTATPLPPAEPVTAATPLPESAANTDPHETPTALTKLPPELLAQSASPTGEPPGVQPMGRAPDEVTRPLPVNSTPPQGQSSLGRTRDDVTRPISVEQAEAEVTRETALPGAPRVKVALERDPSREIRIRGGSRSMAMAELEEIAREWGVDEQQIERILKSRRPRMVEATAELERLLRKPKSGPVPSKAEAMAGLRELLRKRAPVLEIDRTPRPQQHQQQAEAAGGEDVKPVKKAR
jgi:uncharacterized protein (TIGR02266 family)